jgi:DNA-binding response OmpR family regulator
VVEDDADLLSIVQIALEHEGYEVEGSAPDL